MRARAASPAPRLSWFKSGLFWRTFLLLGLLISLAMASWIGMISYVQRAPQVKQTAEMVISVVTITHAALIHSAPELRRELLFELVSNEGIRIQTLENSDTVDPPPDNELMPEIEALVKAKLGADTRFSSRVNGVPGFWISFKIDDDAYWLMLERERLEVSGVQWLGWASVVGVLLMFAAALMSSLVNLPLARLTAAARAIAQGKRPPPLPEKGAQEIIEANRSFNQMVDDLQRVESDRAVILAGISHDLRTPLARMQLEVEMAKLSNEAREGMHSDIAQMDAIIGQFLDYARPTETSSFVPVNISELLADTAHNVQRMPGVQVRTRIEADLHVMGNGTDLRRVFNNLTENARRYGKTPGGERCEIEIACQLVSSGGARRVQIELQDHGAGVPPDQLEQVLKPFTRMDSARGQANGAGLGLAIVARVVHRHHGELQLANRAGGGLHIRVLLPAAS